METKEKKSKITIPKYTLGEEIFNSITHGIGAAFAIVFLVLTIVASAHHGSALAVVVSCIYGSSMIIMYLISCLYHALGSKLKAKKVFRVLDHCDIYIFIAGCYTPFALIAIGGVAGYILFGFTWTCALVGILFNSINLEKFKKVSLGLYLLMGWAIIFSLESLLSNVALPGIILLLSGGIVYTIGAILYVIGKKIKYCHSIFHIFILCASILQFFSIYLYVI